MIKKHDTAQKLQTQTYGGNSDKTKSIMFTDDGVETKPVFF